MTVFINTGGVVVDGVGVQQCSSGASPPASFYIRDLPPRPGRALVANPALTLTRRDAEGRGGLPTPALWPSLGLAWPSDSIGWGGARHGNLSPAGRPGSTIPTTRQIVWRTRPPRTTARPPGQRQRRCWGRASVHGHYHTTITQSQPLGRPRPGSFSPPPPSPWSCPRRAVRSGALLARCSVTVERSGTLPPYPTPSPWLRPCRPCRPCPAAITAPLCPVSLRAVYGRGVRGGAGCGPGP